MQGGPEQSRIAWLRACDAFLGATLAYTRYLQAGGRLTDPESRREVAMLEAEHQCVQSQLSEMKEERAAQPLRLPDDPAERLALAARRQLRRYREAVCSDSRRLGAQSAELVRQLETEGVDAFARSYEELLAALRAAAAPSGGAGRDSR